MKEIEAYEKEIPTFKTDRAAADFLDKADLTRYDFSGAQLTRWPEIKHCVSKGLGRE